MLSMADKIKSVDVFIRAMDTAVWRQLRIDALAQGVTMAREIEDLWLVVQMHDQDGSLRAMMRGAGR
jgi:hypothetical protein